MKQDRTAVPQAGEDLVALEGRLPSVRWAMEFLSHLEFLPALRAWVRGVCRCVCAGDSRAAGSLELAVTETVSNVIRHAYGGLPA